MRKKFQKNTPDIVSYLIVLFFDDHKMIPCNVYKSTVINGDFGVDRVSLRAVMDMIVGESAQYFMTLDNNLYVTGNNASGQLGLSESCLTMNDMTELDFFKNDDMKWYVFIVVYHLKYCYFDFYISIYIVNLLARDWIVSIVLFILLTKNYMDLDGIKMVNWDVLTRMNGNQY